MENIFSFRRFWLLVHKHAYDYGLTMLISLLIFCSLAIFTVTLNVTNIVSSFSQFYIFLLIVFGGFLTNSFYKDWSQKPRSMMFLLIPATSIEKIAVVLFYNLILFLPFMSAAFYGSYYLLTEISSPFKPQSFCELTYSKSSLFTAIILPYIFTQSLALLFVISFKKNQILKLFLVYVVLAIVFLISNNFYIQELSGCKSVAFFPWTLFHSNIQYYNNNYHSGFIEITSPVIGIVNNWIYTIMTLLFYMASYFKLKEKEI